MSTTAHSIAYDDLCVGQTASQTHDVNETDLQMFAAVSGDNNPVHLDETFAATSRFKERIAHGMFTGALISAAIACKLPGPGSVYLSQQLGFMRPVKIGDTLEVPGERKGNDRRRISFLYGTGTDDFVWCHAWKNQKSSVRKGRK